MRVPWAISVSGIVDPETRLYDDLPVSCTPDQMNAWISSLTRQQKGAVRQRFVDLIERNQSKAFQIEIKRLIDDCIKRLNPKTKDERTRALEVAQLWVAGCLGIKWRILPWKVERLERVLEQLFAASCKSLPDLQALEATAVEKLHQHLREAKRLKLDRRGHKVEFTPDQVKAADVYLKGNYIYVPPVLLSEWLPGQDGVLAINYLDKQSLLMKPPAGRATRKVQITILRDRKSVYAIDMAFLSQGSPAEEAEAADTDEGGAEVTLAATDMAVLGEDSSAKESEAADTDEGGDEVTVAATDMAVLGEGSPAEEAEAADTDKGGAEVTAAATQPGLLGRRQVECDQQSSLISHRRTILRLLRQRGSETEIDRGAVSGTES
jgi:hypothetical protein